MQIDPNKPTTPDRNKLYELYLNKIKESDEISFKLMGLVPLISGGGVFALLKGDKLFSDTNWIDVIAYWGIGLFGALVTYFIYRWELRNIQTCTLFRDYAAGIEGDLEFRKQEDEEVISLKGIGPYTTLSKKSPRLLGFKFGKTKAEQAIYILSILFWITLPILKTVHALALTC